MSSLSDLLLPLFQTPLGPLHWPPRAQVASTRSPAFGSNKGHPYLGKVAPPVIWHSVKGWQVQAQPEQLSTTLSQKIQEGLGTRVRSPVLQGSKKEKKAIPELWEVTSEGRGPSKAVVPVTADSQHKEVLLTRVVVFFQLLGVQQHLPAGNKITIRCGKATGHRYSVMGCTSPETASHPRPWPGRGRERGASKEMKGHK